MTKSCLLNYLKMFEQNFFLSTQYIYAITKLFVFNDRKLLCIPESFNTNILHHLFDYTITFVNSQH